MSQIANSKIIKISVFLILLSYFYNLPVMSYSIKGDNELRLYDFIGLIFFYHYIFNFNVVNASIARIIYLKNFYRFLVYCTIMLVVTLFIYVYKDRLTKFLQSFLYLYHMWVFFLSAVFTHYHLSNFKSFKKITYFFLLLISLSAFIVILQNLGFVPFLWSNAYKIAYGGFLSGTFGPNKIVLGMSMLISCGFIIGLLYSKLYEIPKLFLYIPLSLSLVALLLSGSRTSYLGLGIFFLYFFFTYTSRFLFFILIGGGFAIIIGLLSPTIVDKISDVLDNRITEQIENPEELQGIGDAGQLYSDLGAGRDELHIRYVKFLLNNPQLIPFGQGFNNRSGIGFSAHNMYLTVVAELGLLGFLLYFNWLISYFKISKSKQPGLQLAVNGLVLAMIVTLYFGEHLYVYRPLFGLLGLFMITFVILLYPLRIKRHATTKE